MFNIKKNKCTFSGFSDYGGVYCKANSYNCYKHKNITLQMCLFVYNRFDPGPSATFEHLPLSPEETQMNIEYKKSR